MGDGVDIYSPGQSYPDIHLKNQPLLEEQNIPVQVSWLHGDAAIVSGSFDGGVRIWAMPTGELLQLLEHEGMSTYLRSAEVIFDPFTSGCIVQAVAVCHTIYFYSQVIDRCT